MGLVMWNFTMPPMNAYARYKGSGVMGSMTYVTVRGPANQLGSSASRAFGMTRRIWRTESSFWLSGVVQAASRYGRVARLWWLAKVKTRFSANTVTAAISTTAETGNHDQADGRYPW